MVSQLIGFAFLCSLVFAPATRLAPGFILKKSQTGTPVAAKSHRTGGSQEGKTATSIAITIDVIVDSLNHLHATLQAESGTNARDLMEQIFQIDYGDRSRKFIRGIAGFAPGRFEKKYWALEINGVYSSIGIAEITLTAPTTIVWRLKPY